jgi:hypothetical protein
MPSIIYGSYVDTETGKLISLPISISPNTGALIVDVANEITSEITSTTYTVTTVTPVIVATHSRRFLSLLSPGENGTLLLETTADGQAAVDAGTAKWVSWPWGAVGVETVDTFDGISTHLRITAAGATGTARVAI